jgi:transposase
VTKRTHYLSLRDDQKRAAVRAEAVRSVREKLSTITEVADHYGVSRETVYNWLEVAAKAGDGSVPDRRKAKRSRLTKEQEQELVRLVEAQPRAAGYDFDFWTLSKIRTLIMDRFGVYYGSLSCVWVKLRELNLSTQKPEREAKERDSKKDRIESFFKEVLPGVEKKSS